MGDKPENKHKPAQTNNNESNHKKLGIQLNCLFNMFFSGHRLPKVRVLRLHGSTVCCQQSRTPPTPWSATATSWDHCPSWTCSLLPGFRAHRPPGRCWSQNCTCSPKSHLTRAKNQVNVKQIPGKIKMVDAWWWKNSCLGRKSINNTSWDVSRQEQLKLMSC